MMVKKVEDIKEFVAVPLLGRGSGTRKMFVHFRNEQCGTMKCSLEETFPLLRSFRQSSRTRATACRRKGEGKGRRSVQVEMASLARWKENQCFGISRYHSSAVVADIHHIHPKSTFLESFLWLNKPSFPSLWPPLPALGQPLDHSFAL